MVGIRDLSVPTAGGNWLAWGQAADKHIRALAEAGFHLDEYTGTDQQKWDAAVLDHKAATDRNMPAIVLPNRPLTFTTPNQWWSGSKVVPSSVGAFGQKNPELSSGQFVGPEITFGGSVGLDTASWFHNGAGLAQIYDVFHAGLSFQGSQGSAIHQAYDCAVGTMYACCFHAISSNFLAGLYGRGATRKFLSTQIAWTGMSTQQNVWQTNMNVGGSDCSIYVDALCNVGTSGSAAQTGSATQSANNCYYWRFDSLEAQVGKGYLSALNGWRNILVSGNGSSIDFHGGVYEGYRDSRTNGLLVGPGPGTLFRVTGGNVNLFGTKIGQGMDNPAAGEGGVLQVDGGEVNGWGVCFYGRNMGSPAAGNTQTRRAALYHRGGRVRMSGIQKRQSESAFWTGRPTFDTTAPVDADGLGLPAYNNRFNSGTYSYFCDDLSMTTF